MPTGAYPIAEETEVGAFRVEIGDSVPVGTPSGGNAEFEFFSDTYITALLAKYPDEPEAAMASALDTMARRLMIEAEDIQVDDIKIKTIERANMFSKHADNIRLYGVTRGAEGFGVVALSTGPEDTHVQGIAYPYPQVG